MSEEEKAVPFKVEWRKMERRMKTFGASSLESLEMKVSEWLAEEGAGVDLYDMRFSTTSAVGEDWFYVVFLYGVEVKK